MALTVTSFKDDDLEAFMDGSSRSAGLSNNFGAHSSGKPEKSLVAASDVSRWIGPPANEGRYTFGGA